MKLIRARPAGTNFVIDVDLDSLRVAYNSHSIVWSTDLLTWFYVADLRALDEAEDAALQSVGYAFKELSR